MSQSSKTISCRFEIEEVEQIQNLAEASGQSISDWFRSEIRQVIHAQTQETQIAPVQPVRSLADLLREIKALIQQNENVYRAWIDEFKATFDREAKALREDRSCEVEVTQAIYEDTVERIEATRDEMLEAIHRVKQSQRSHKDTLRRAIDDAQASEQSHY